MHAPKVTVIMPVHNGELYLRDAVQSILTQTFGDFELLVIDDGSSDGTAGIIAALGDKRVVPIANERNLGLISTLNLGLSVARGEYVARMDCDDMSLPRRLEKQVALMDARPNVGACGTWIRKVGAVKPKTCRYHQSSSLLACGLLFDPTLAHPTVMLRRSVFQDNGLQYDHAFRHAEDYDLWVRAARFCQFANVPEVLLNYRIHPWQVSQLNSLEQADTAGRVRRVLLGELGLAPGAGEFEIHQRISTCSVAGGDFFRRADDWLCSVYEANRQYHVYPEPELALVLAERLVTLLKKALEQGLFPDMHMIRPRLFRVSGLDWSAVVRFLLRSRRGVEVGDA